MTSQWERIRVGMTPRDRRGLLAAIGAGKVYAANGKVWRQASRVHKVPVSAKVLDEYVAAGWVIEGDTYTLTDKGREELGK